MGRKVTIHQPEHFPYMGFFQKIQSADLYIVLDNVKFRKNYFQNRNKFLNNNGVEEWFTVPVHKKANSMLIKDIVVSESPIWRKKIVNKLKQNLHVDLTEIYDCDTLLDINLKGIEWCLKKLDIDTPMVLASSLGVVGKKSELLANIVKEVGGTEYISGPSGREYLEKDYFDQTNITFFEPNAKNYYSTLYNIQKGVRNV